MKQFFFILSLAVFVVACKDRNDELSQISDISVAAIDSISVPQDTVSLGTAVNIKTYSTMLADCESFSRFNYKSSGFTREITSEKLKLNTTCGASTVVTSDFSFAPQAAGSYILKFKNSATADTWISHTIVVK